MPNRGLHGKPLESVDMNRLSIGLSFLSALSALIAARYWRAASQVYGNIDRLWLDGSDDIPDFVWATAALGAIKESGDLNRKAASWAAISATVSFTASAASFW
jgi:hypothetical protein